MKFDKSVSTGRHRIDADAARAKQRRKMLHQRVDGALGCRKGRDRADHCARRQRRSKMTWLDARNYPMCKNAATRNGDRINDAPSRHVIHENSQACPISIGLRKIILVASQFFEFLHSLGHQRRFERAPATSASIPIPDVLLSRSKRPLGPNREVEEDARDGGMFAH